MREELSAALERFLNEDLKGAVLSNPRQKGAVIKVQIRPVAIKGSLYFQAEEFTDKQAFHRNMDRDQAALYIEEALRERFKQMELTSSLGTVHALVSKKGKMTVKVKNQVQKTASGEGDLTRAAGKDLEVAWRPSESRSKLESLSHNRKKRYILEEGTPVPFLVDLGVMTPEGKVVRSRYDKFRQINRFLEFIEDVLPRLDKNRENRIIDFGCGKSYLTFAMYYYLKEKMGYPVRITGLDLKQDVIEHCSRLSRKYGYEDGLDFACGDIAGYEGESRVDMVVTLHACDTATDFALDKAVRWGAKVIHSVPCCQHELNRQMENRLLEPVFQYGIIKERMAALYTDALRAELLEQKGYRTQILEFIDMEHTPKNLLIRAVYQGKPKHNEKELGEIMEFLHIQPSLAGLLNRPTEKV